MLWQFFAFTFAFSTFFSGFALFAERRFMYNGSPFGTKEVGYVFAFSGLIGVLIQGGGMGSLVKAFGESRLVQVGFATMAVGFALLAGVHGIPYLLLAVGLLTFGSAILRPSLTALITARAICDPFSQVDSKAAANPQLVRESGWRAPARAAIISRP